MISRVSGSIVFEQIEDARNIITTWGGASMQINLDN